MKYRHLISIIASIVLTGCSGSADTQSNVSAAEKDAVNVSESISETDTEELLEVKVISYEDDTLSFVRDDETLSLKMSPELFANDTYTRGKKTMSEKIISNSFGLETKGYIRLDGKGNIKYCDVFKANGDQFDSSMTAPSGTPYEKTFMNMKRIKGSKYEFSNSYTTFTADLNELSNDLKADYGEEQQGVEVSGYRFKTGEVMIESISIFDHEETVGGETQYYFTMLDNYDKYSFFGTVKSLSEDRASVLLTDGKTAYVVLVGGSAYPVARIILNDGDGVALVFVARFHVDSGDYAVSLRDDLAGVEILLGLSELLFRGVKIVARRVVGIAERFGLLFDSP